ncbi:hypothetical protein [uncultured Acinetobacter sp.]|uniref:hypothetical protein n=1 Tax=uncultured Acinetobacter sp. TaxID=165433 RepID=UPI002625CDCE|nr:hypothetical protein [uncultured Acinetobacter sp.]
MTAKIIHKIVVRYRSVAVLCGINTVIMPKKRTKRDCVEVRVCLYESVNERVKKYQAKKLMEGEELKKPEATESLIELGLKSQGL